MIFNRLFVATTVAVSVATPLAAISFAREPVPVVSKTGAVVEIMPGAFNFPVPGEFLSDGRPANAPVVEQLIARPISMMKYQVSQAEYQRCVDAGACKAADATISADADIRPITGVNYLDAQAYAAWYSGETGEHWRLPSDAEWAYAAAERFVGESYSAIASDPDNPAVAWIRRYEEEAALSRAPDPVAHPLGHFGPNTRGIHDLGGNVWEWTSTCYQRTTLDQESGEAAHRIENCRVHIAEGRHRAYMSDFVRDGVSGGCAVGRPPDNLGFRLVREARRSLPQRLLDGLWGAIFSGPVS
ncbi:MAG: SUMF1/EgtB/PvdO family nonheme iron enzyme [Rhizobiaceae bacterium]|nr:SUMF1/EgtB/PvdO family nonheme iron enzyme [Rhizobiaceae bacterium]